jgi:hypothetical protein
MARTTHNRGKNSTVNPESFRGKRRNDATTQRGFSLLQPLAAPERIGEGGSALSRCPFSLEKMAKNRRVSAAQDPLYHVLVGLQHLFFI